MVRKLLKLLWISLTGDGIRQRIIAIAVGTLGMFTAAVATFLFPQQQSETREDLEEVRVDVVMLSAQLEDLERSLDLDGLETRLIEIEIPLWPRILPGSIAAHPNLGTESMLLRRRYRAHQ